MMVCFCLIINKQCACSYLMLVLTSATTDTEYSGQWMKNRFHGEGCRRFKNGNVYTGKYICGKREGLGRCYFANGDMYVGDWKKVCFESNNPHWQKHIAHNNSKYPNHFFAPGYYSWIRTILLQQWTQFRGYVS